MIALFSYALSRMKVLHVFESSIQLISLEEPDLWKEMYGVNSYMTISACLIALTGVQICLLILICKFKVMILLCGIKWGDLQQKSRSSEYFLVASLVAVPVIIAMALFEVFRTANLFAPFPEIHIMNKPMEYSLYVTFGIVCIVNIYSYFCVMLNSI
jgi:hypothetical protein